MVFKALTTKLDTKTLRALKSVSERTRISQAELVREGIELVLRRHAEDAVTPELRNEIDLLLKDDAALLKRLSRA